MRRLTRPTILLALATLPLFLLAGCGRPSAKIRYVTGGPDETVSYDSGTFQRARSRKVQVVLFRRTAAPIGEADPDFEYVFLELPDRSHYGWLKEDRIPAYRWVRQGGHDRIWLATAGQVRLTLLGRSLRLDFRTTMEPVAGTPGGAYVLTAVVRCPEDLIRTQGLINRYGQWLQSLLVAPPPASPPSPPRSARRAARSSPNPASRAPPMFGGSSPPASMPSSSAKASSAPATSRPKSPSSKGRVRREN